MAFMGCLRDAKGQSLVVVFDVMGSIPRADSENDSFRTICAVFRWLEQPNAFFRNDSH